MAWFKSARTEAMVQYVLFTILVVLTPFIVVTRYLQGVVHIASHLSFPAFGIEVPVILVIAVIGMTALAVWQFKHLTLRRLAGLGVVAALIAFAQQTMDLYLQMSFFDLQQNWHYVAYGAYAFFFFRAFNARNMAKHKMILIAYVSAIGMSLFDEVFQYFMSGRVFDISDITKDALGLYCGLILVLFVTETYGTIELKEHSVTHPRLKDYFKDPLSALVMVGILTLSFVLVSPLLTAHENIVHCLLIGFALFFIIMFVIHFSQIRWFKIGFISVALLIVVLMAGSFFVNSDKGITHNANGLTVYRGIPLPFFDVIIYPNQSFHLVDKKHLFNRTDRDYLMEHTGDILLIGSGSTGQGGKGFDLEVGTYFIFNNFTFKGTQIIILPTPDACEKYNQLKADGKSVLFVLHNTC
jgi:VanZ family protein